MSKLMHRTLEKKLASSIQVITEDDNSDEETEVLSAISKSKHGGGKPSAVIYLGHLPENFEEDQIGSFLSQFGSIVQCRISRSKRSGRPRGYGFVEFVDAAVARIVANTMSGYFLTGKRIVCHIMPSDKVHDKLFQGAGKKFAIHRGSDLLAERVREKMSTAAGLKKISQSLVKRDKDKRAKLASLGIDYGYPELKVKKDINTPPSKKEETVTKESQIKKDKSASESKPMKRKRDIGAEVEEDSPTTIPAISDKKSKTKKKNESKSTSPAPKKVTKQHDSAVANPAEVVKVTKTPIKLNTTTAKVLSPKATKGGKNSSAKKSKRKRRSDQRST